MKKVQVGASQKCAAPGLKVERSNAIRAEAFPIYLKVEVN